MNNLTVALNGVEVGTLERDNRGAMAFHYKTQWLNTSSVGRDCIGAIQLYPEGCDIPSVDQVYAEPLDENSIIQLLEGYQTSPLGMDGQNDFRISLAGAQEKTALLWHQNTWQRPHGSTPTSHIFKLPIGKVTHNSIDLSESCENEWLCLKLAQAKYQLSDNDYI